MKHLRRVGLPVFVLACLVASAWRGGYGTPQRGREEWIPAGALGVHDGDTFFVDGRELRLLGVDTPERGAPWFDGDQEPWASRAAELVEGRLASVSQVAILASGQRDLHGRELVHVVVGGEPLAVSLVRAGLAYPTIARYGDHGHPEIAQRIVREAKAPAFEVPWRWRRDHRLD